ncbi:sensor histidine kinase [Streptomyces sp. NBC_00258]|uniref:sensor histidine kinase n=1 Tax=Streptomyces sp. NBC_00258 TaxID=2903642 RepID=UPI002E29D465|nr:ATP-binding protein [Streptomyces sp. NBC_00258]
MRYSRADWLPARLVVGQWFSHAKQVRNDDVVIAIEGYSLAEGVGSVPDQTLRSGAVLRYELLRDGAPMEVEVALARPPLGRQLVTFSGPLLYLSILGVLALWLRARRPAAPTGTPLLLGFAGMFAWLAAGPAVGMTALDAATGSALFWLYHIATLGGGSLAWGAMVALALVPLRAHRPGSYRWLSAAAYGGPLLLLAGWTGGVLVLGPSGMPAIGWIHAGQETVTVACWIAAGLFSLQVYRRAVPRHRRPLRWVLGGGLLSGLGLFALWLVPDIVVGYRPTTIRWVGLAGLPILVGITVAILRYHLYAIERVISRALGYTALAAVLFGCYLSVTVAAATTAASDTTVAAAAAVSVAVIALPVREAIRRRAAQRLFGGREQPAETLRALGRALAQIPSPQQALPHVVVAVTQALRLPYAAVEFTDPTAPGGFRTAEHSGAPVGARYSQLMYHHGRAVGRLTVSAREVDEPLSASDLALLGEVAAQLGPAMQAVALHEEVLRSRTAAVATREDERRRLRRDLHDGLSPTLSGLSLKTEAALALLDSWRSHITSSPTPADGEDMPVLPRVDPDRFDSAHRLLLESAAGMRTTAHDLRLLVEGLRPPALDSLGLMEAIRLRMHDLAADTAGTPHWEVVGPAGTTGLPAAVEVAAYHIAVEAMANCIRHAHASHCLVRIGFAAPSGPLRLSTFDGEALLLQLEVVDDGVGLPVVIDDRGPGFGLRSMRERAEELGGRCTVRIRHGGGTAVHAVLPCPPSGHSAQQAP